MAVKLTGSYKVSGSPQQDPVIVPSRNLSCNTKYTPVSSTSFLPRDLYSPAPQSLMRSLTSACRPSKGILWRS